MTDDRDDLRAELEYLTQRDRELREELDRQLSELAGGGPALTADMATPAYVETLVHGIVDSLRRSGNDGLALKFMAALSEWQQKNEHLTTVIATLRPLPEWTSEDAARLEEAKAASDDSQEQLDRVQAEVSAWFDRLGGQ
jgi:hypothetical protein